MTTNTDAVPGADDAAQDFKANEREFGSILIEQLCELPDRNSPEDEPDAMVATPAELRDCIERALDKYCFVIAGAGTAAQPAHTERPLLEAEIARLNAIIHSPESDEFLKGVAIEAEYQRQLHGVDATDARFDWAQYFWVTGYLLNKALAACKSGEGNGAKAKHHLVTTAALLNNWHNVLTGKPTACVHSNNGKPVADLIAAPASSAGDQS